MAYFRFDTPTALLMEAACTAYQGNDTSDVDSSFKGGSKYGSNRQGTPTDSREQIDDEYLKFLDGTPRNECRKFIHSTANCGSKSFSDESESSSDSSNDSSDSESDDSSSSSSSCESSSSSSSSSADSTVYRHKFNNDFRTRVAARGLQFEFTPLSPYRKGKPLNQMRRKIDFGVEESYED